jgi:Holliday junction resolvasome RuvABC ATP-dependent DNA helicase subunit
MSNKIRPTTFDEIIGQNDVISRLKVSIAGAKRRRDSTFSRFNRRTSWPW